MIYLTPRISLDASSSSNRVVFASSPVDQFIQLESLKLFVDLPSLNKDLSLANNHKKVQLSIRDKSSSSWELIAELILFNKGFLYREDLLLFLTSKDSFRLAPNHELALNIATLGGFSSGGLLSGTDSIRLIGQAYQNSSESSGQVVQNFITATYSIPNRDALLALPLSSNWGVFEVARSPKHYKDQIGRVHVTGFVKQLVATTNDVICNLPVGYRPPEDLDFIMNANTGLTTVRVLTSGNIQNTGTIGSFLNLTAISFLAA